MILMEASIEYYERLKGILKPGDDEIDRDRLKQIAGELDPERKDDPAFLEMLGQTLGSLGYRYNTMFATWIKKPRQSRLQRFLSSIWRSEAL